MANSLKVPCSAISFDAFMKPAHAIRASAPPTLMRRMGPARLLVGGAWLASGFMALTGFFTEATPLLVQRLLAGVASAFVFIAGGLLAFYTRYLNVDSFSLLISIEALSMLIVGGLGTVAGALLGTAFIVLLNEGLGFLFGMIGASFGGSGSTAAYEIKGVIYGLAIVLFLRFEPDGLVGRWRDIKHYWTHWPFRF